MVELHRCVDVFAAVGARYLTLHPDRHAAMHDRRFFIDRNLATLRELMPYAESHGVGLMLENFPGDFSTAAQLGYDGTITLEVSTPDSHHLAYSRDLLQRVWAGARGAGGE